MAACYSLPRFRITFSVLALGLLMTFVGCDSGSGGTVSGTVKYKGQPLTGGTVAFTPSKGDPQSGIIGTDGKYTVTKVPVGPAKISVTSNAEATAGGGAGMKQAPLPGMPAVPKGIVIPAKYNDPEQSGLTLEVKKGKQPFNIDLD